MWKRIHQVIIFWFIELDFVEHYNELNEVAILQATMQSFAEAATQIKQLWLIRFKWSQSIPSNESKFFSTHLPGQTLAQCWVSVIAVSSALSRVHCTKFGQLCTRENAWPQVSPLISVWPSGCLIDGKHWYQNRNREIYGSRQRLWMVYGWR